MPSVQKILYFLSSAILVIVGDAVIGYGISTDWASATMSCASSNTSGSVTLQMGLFSYNESKIFCPFFSKDDEIQGKLRIYESCNNVTLIVMFISLYCVQTIFLCLCLYKSYYLLLYYLLLIFNNIIIFRLFLYSIMSLLYVSY